MGWARTAVALTITLGCGAWAPGARADVYAGAGQDPVGDQAAGSTAARDITAFSARYDDDAGTIEVGVRLAAVADASTNAVVTARVAEGCGGPGALLVDRLVPSPADPGVWVTSDDPAQRPLARGGTPPSITLAASDFVALAYEDYDCLVVRTAPAQGAPYDEAQVALADVTAPPAPAPSPAPAPPSRPGDPPPLGPSPLTRAERLQARLAACPKAPRARRRACRRAAFRRYGPSRPQQLRTALDACAKRRGGAERACERRARRRYRGVKPAPRRSPLERRLFAYAAPDPLGRCGGICWEALAFVDRRSVHVGLPEGAALPACKRVTYDARTGTGCSTYRLARNRRTVRVAGKAYRIARRGKALTRRPDGGGTERTTLERQVFPAAGARWDVPRIEAIAVDGSPLIGTQVITRTYLTLTRDGRFAKSSVFFGSSAPGSDPGLIVSGAPPDSRGTYAVLPAGTIRLSYADGRLEVGSTFFWDPAKGRDPNRAGLHVGEDTFFGPPGG